MYLFSSKITQKNIMPEGQQGSEALTAARYKKCLVIRNMSSYRLVL